MLDTVNNLLANKTIPALDTLQMSDLLHYLFTNAERAVRIQVAEVAYRHDHDHPNALDVFLACVLPLAERAARSRARKFKCPTDWQRELMYDGAVAAAIDLFQRHYSLWPGTEAFGRFIVRSLAHGTVRLFYKRDEHLALLTFGDARSIRCTKPLPNSIEQDVITKDLLNRVISFPHLRDPLRDTLQCIAALGPDGALKEHAFTASGDPDKWKRQRKGRPILDPDAIAAAMGTTRAAVHRNLKEARLILRDVFNADGKLFMNC